MIPFLFTIGLCSFSGFLLLLYLTTPHKSMPIIHLCALHIPFFSEIQHRFNDFLFCSLSHAAHIRNPPCSCSAKSKPANNLSGLFSKALSALRRHIKASHPVHCTKPALNCNNELVDLRIRTVIISQGQTTFGRAFGMCKQSYHPLSSNALFIHWR